MNAVTGNAGATRASADAELRLVDSPGPVIRAGFLILLLGIVMLAAWMAVVPISGAVIAPGVVKVDRNRKVVQHQEGGIVRSILVREGERVQAGQTLIELGDIQVDAGVELLRSQLDAELARSARLAAERAMARELSLPDEMLARRTDPRIALTVEREASLLESRRRALDGQVALLEEQVRQTVREIDARLVQDEADEAAIRLQREELAANEALLRDGFVSRARLLGLRRAVAEYESRRGTNQAELAQARQREAELRLRIVAIGSEYTQQAERELRDSTARQFDLRERLRPTQDAARRQSVVAPVAGEVVDLRVTTAGAPIGPRERLMEIVPSDAELVVEARVRPEDMNHVQVEAKADVRLTALLRRITPTVLGTVIHVSADRLADPVSQAGYFVVHVRVDPDSLARQGNLLLKPGMPVEVYVRTVERTPLQYLLDPVLGFIGRSLREP